MKGRDDMAATGSAQALARFWAKVNKSDEGCWIWVACRATATGYGRFRSNGRTHYAHRWITAEIKGHLSADLDVDHLCGNKGCVRPDHLDVVTHSVNMLRAPCMVARRSSDTCRKGHTAWRHYVVDGRIERHCAECQRIREAA